MARAKYEKKGNMLLLIVCAVIYLVLWYIQGIINSSGNKELEGIVLQMKQLANADELMRFIGPLEGMSHQPNNSLNGVIAQLQVFISVIMVLTNGTNGLISADSLNVFSLLYTAIFTVGIRGNTNALPGVAIPVVTIITISIMYFFTRRTSRLHAEAIENYEQAIENNRIIKEKDEVLSYLAYYDRITQLPNRQLFMDNLEERIKDGEDFTVVFIDIDNFRYINDSYGHSTGDELLVKYAEKLGAYCGENNFVAKIGGDEYGIILESTSPQDINQFVNGIMGIFAEPIKLRSDVFQVTASFGAAVFPKDARSSEEIFRCSETAMFNAKSNGKNQLFFFVR